MAIPFDVTQLEVTGAPVVVVEDVMHAERGDNRNLITGAGQFTVSDSGSLAYVSGGVYPVNETSLVWVDHGGTPEPITLPPANYRWPRVSPSGTQLAYGEGNFGGLQLWVYDIELETPVRLTTTGSNINPVWGSDGRRLAFSVTEGANGLFWMAADGSGEPQRVTESNASQLASSWSPDDVLAFLQGGDIWTVSMDGGGAPEPFLETPAIEAWPVFSPDGRWLAYASNETGRYEVYVRPFPGGEPVRRVSTAGGGAPVWSPEGHQLFFRISGEDRFRGLMVAAVSTDAMFTHSQPGVLFDGEKFVDSIPVRGYDLAPDGQRFVMTTDPSQVEQQPVTSIHVVLNSYGVTVVNPRTV